MSRRGDEILAAVTGVTITDRADPGVLAVLERRILRNGELGGVKPTKENAILVLERDPHWDGRIWANELDGMIYLDNEPIRDEQETSIYRWIFRCYEFHVGDTDLSKAIALVAYQQRRHPVREYLNGLTWDGTARLDDWLSRYCRASAAPLIGRIGACWMISAVARVMDPGCKVDTCLIFKSKQGATKSTTFEALAVRPEWFSDSDIDMTSKDKYQSIQGVWIYELAELSSIRKADNNSVKSFVTSRRDRYRPAFGRYQVVQKRQTVFVGSTNEEAFLTDPTGSRRFWPVTVGAIDKDGLLAVRDQLWAEALSRYKAGAQWWLTKPEEEALYLHNQQYRQGDIWEETIEAWASKRAAPFTQAEVMEDALGREMKSANGRDEIRTRSVLTALGYTSKQMRLTGQGKARRWWRDTWNGKPWETP